MCQRVTVGVSFTRVGALSPSLFCGKPLPPLTPESEFVGRPPEQVVPASPQFLERFSKLLWNSLLPTSVKAELQCHFSFTSQRDEIPRQVEFLKAIASLEVAQAVIKPICIHKVREPLLRAAFDGFG